MDGHEAQERMGKHAEHLGSRKKKKMDTQARHACVTRNVSAHSTRGTVNSKMKGTCHVFDRFRIEDSTATRGRYTN